MKFWVEAQLPPLLAAWLSEQFHVEALEAPVSKGRPI